MHNLTLTEKVCLVIPCYNEEDRLDLKRFENFDPNCYFLFVNDGSKDKTLELLTGFTAQHKDERFEVLNIEENGGKGQAVRKAMLHIKQDQKYRDIQWVGFWDADLSTSLDELYNFFSYKKLYDIDVNAVWGSRVYKLGSEIIRLHSRHYLGRVFATVIGILLKVKCYDSQCGAKIFKKEIIDAAFEEVFISRWIFDVEILLRLNNNIIIECPLKKWEDIAGSKIKIIPVAIRTLIEVLKIRKRYRNVIK